MKVKLLSYTPNPEKIVAMAGKLCYAGCSIDELEEDLTEEEINKFVNMLISIGHESPLEHISFTFAVEGVSRITEQQLTRHRIASYSIQSGRYVKRDNAEFTTPENIQNNVVANEIYKIATESSKNKYDEIVNLLVSDMIFKFVEDNYKDKSSIYQLNICNKFQDLHKKEYSKFKKKAIEDARMIFPNSLQTKIIFTMNLRTLINFFEHRCCMRSQNEIRELANQMLRLCREVSPILFNRLGASCKVKGYCPEGNMQCDEFKNIVPTLKELIDTRLKYKNLINKDS